MCRGSRRYEIDADDHRVILLAWNRLGRFAAKDNTVCADTAIQKTSSTSVAEEEQRDNQEEVQDANAAMTPVEFFAEITKRADIRAILEALARN